MWSEVVQIFQRYMGTGIIVIWFIAALTYLFLNEKRKERRILFVYMPAIILLLYFNPLFFGIFYRVVGSEIYFRVCWLLPVIAYAAVCFAESRKGKTKRLCVIATVMLMAVSGKLVYDNFLYSKAENIYHLPDSVINICDAIVVPGREVMAVFPSELAPYVRQYSPFVCMPYGRHGWGNVGPDQFTELSDFITAMEEEYADLEVLAPMADRAGCHYIIIDLAKEIRGSEKAYDLEIFAEIDGYRIYRNTKMPLDF